MAGNDRAYAERVAQAREAARAADGPTAAKRELADALRALIEELPQTAADEAEIRALIGPVECAAARFAAAGRASPARAGQTPYAGMEDFHEKGPLIGLANPVAPPLQLWVDAEAGLARGRGRFGRRYEGAPGLLHGGTLAAAFDEVMGLATIFSGGAGMTRELTVRYLRPTPIEVELRFAARLDRAEGRRLFVTAEVEADGVRTAEASGTFTAVGGGTFEAFARARREREGGG
jgi:acyl-coenzyme A thioesterase PaaI-like protein